MTEKERIISDASKYTAAVYLAQVLAVITAIVMRKYLGPYLMGVVAALMVVFTYAWYAQAGIIQAVERELPFFYGQGNDDRAALVRDTGFTISLIVGVGAMLAVWAVAFFLKDSLPPVVVFGLVVYGFAALINQVTQFYGIALRARKEFGLISKARAIFSLVGTLGNAAVVILFSIYGLYLLFPLLILAELAYLYWNTRYSFAIKIKLSEVKRLLVIGLPIFVGGLGFDTLRNVDKMVIIGFLGAEALGFYSIALMVHNYIYFIPNVFSMVMYPRFQESYGAFGSIERLKAYVIVPTQALSGLLPILLGGFYIGVPFLVRHVLPQYTEGIDSLKILIIGTFFLGLHHMPAQFLLTINKQLKSMPIGWVAAGAGFVLGKAFIDFGWGINGVAISAVISYALFYILIMGYALSHLSTFRETVGVLLHVFMSLLYSMVILLLVDRLSPSAGVDIVSDMRITSMQLILFGVASIPMVLYIDRKTGVLTTIFGMLKPRVAFLTGK